MASPISFNGVTYDSLDAMPDEVRQAYEKTEPNPRGLAGLDVVVAERHSVQRGGGAVKQTFVVNGTSYGDEKDMPPEVHEAYEKAMATWNVGGTEGNKNQIKLSLRINGPHLHFEKTLGSPPPDQASQPYSIPSPIQPSSTASGFRIAILLVACVGFGLFWLLMRAH
jgi:hypothetical protein